ncbi:hypothetical protein NXT01_02950 [Corynebacterium sp. ES2775-CONJ]|uniref:hypothetical protein n=1 Tax=Corynebacterium sp. ES2715-CONJ3 TaxID=2974028 RepID=UPI002168162E|nr:hypothetical protein [Corynebacterium sp. ES2715-CONJ3]MCS4489550.1 hypothetical protein [Corynebacterium sp. ES2775-CONJ]MCS4491439.1 hypothetical protein [Corynebacterium sp. ES2715-CONJ3]
MARKKNENNDQLDLFEELNRLYQKQEKERNNVSQARNSTQHSEQRAGDTQPSGTDIRGSNKAAPRTQRPGRGDGAKPSPSGAGTFPKALGGGLFGDYRPNLMTVVFI